MKEIRERKKEKETKEERKKEILVLDKIQLRNPSRFTRVILDRRG